ncbi:porin family protein [Shewanella sp.]|nr:porin family protein [Shewanella sp.]
MNKISMLTLATLSMAASNVAMAETDRTGAYIGAQVGAFSSDQTHKTSSNASDSGSGQSYGVYGGYHFNEWFGLESTLYFTNDFIDRKDTRVHLGSYSITPKVTFALNDTFSLYGKAGIEYVSVSSKSGKTTTDFSDYAFVVGAGINAAITDSLNVRLGYDYSSVDLKEDKSNATVIEMDMSNVTLGLHYQF